MTRPLEMIPINFIFGADFGDFSNFFVFFMENPAF